MEAQIFTDTKPTNGEDISEVLRKHKGMERDALTVPLHADDKDTRDTVQKHKTMEKDSLIVPLQLASIQEILDRSTKEWRETRGRKTTKQQGMERDSLIVPLQLASIQETLDRSTKEWRETHWQYQGYETLYGSIKERRETETH